MTTIDSKRLPDWGPFQVDAFLHYDEDSTTKDDEGLTPKQVAAWKADEWQYVGLEIVVSNEDVILGRSSLWGLEHGWFTMTDEDDNVTGEKFINVLDEIDKHYSDVVEEAKNDAIATLDRLLALREAGDFTERVTT